MRHKLLFSVPTNLKATRQTDLEERQKMQGGRQSAETHVRRSFFLLLSAVVVVVVTLVGPAQAGAAMYQVDRSAASRESHGKSTSPSP
jgi:hypothetical protein